MQTVKAVESLVEALETSVVDRLEARDESPNLIEMQILKRRASRYAQEQRALLAKSETDPKDVEADILLKVAVNDIKYELTYDQREDLLKLIMDESGMTALKALELMRRAG